MYEEVWRWLEEQQKDDLAIIRSFMPQLAATSMGHSRLAHALRRTINKYRQSR